MERRPWYKRLLCFVGLHRWHYATPERRTCARCGRWQQWEPDPAGVSAGNWVDF
jgi:hypothetical protein